MKVKIMKEKLEAVILDWAGTTMDYGCMAPAVVFQKVFAEMEVPITMAEARRPMGAHKKVHIQKITEDPAVQGRWKEQYGRNSNEGDVEIVFNGFLMTHLKGRWESRPKFALIRKIIDKFVYKLERPSLAGTVVSDAKDLAKQLRACMVVYQHKIEAMKAEEEAQEKLGEERKDEKKDESQEEKKEHP